MDHLRWGVATMVVTIHAAVTCSGVGRYYHEPAELDLASLASRFVFRRIPGLRRIL